MGVNNYRYDPFLDVASPVTKTNERASIPASSPYTVRLQEVPLKESPTSLTVRVVNWLSAALTIGATTCDVINGSWFAVNDVITIDAEKCLVTNVAGNTLTITRGYDSSAAASHYAGADVFGPLWSEVAAAPASRQFWPDYSTGADSDDSWNTGLLQFNSADAGKQVAISYKGTGTLVDERAFGGLDGFGNYIVEGLTVVPISGLTVGVNPGKAVIAGAPLTQVDQSPIVLTPKSVQLIVKDKTNVNSKVLPKMAAADLVDANTVGLWFPDGSASVPNAAVGVNGSPAVANNLTKTGTITAVDGWAGGDAAKGDGASGYYQSTNNTGYPAGANARELGVGFTFNGIAGPATQCLATLYSLMLYTSSDRNLYVADSAGSFYNTGFTLEDGKFYWAIARSDGTTQSLIVNTVNTGLAINDYNGAATNLFVLRDTTAGYWGTATIHFIEICNALRTPAQIAVLAQKMLIPCSYVGSETQIALTAGMLTNGGFTGFNAANLVDGNLANNGAYFDSVAAGAYITIDIGTAQIIQRVKLFSLAASAGYLKIMLSADGTNYYDASNPMQQSPAMIFDIFTAFKSTVYRYVRIVIATATASSQYISEIQLFSTVSNSVFDIRTALTAPDDSEIIAYIEASATGPRVIIDSSNPKSKSRDRAYGIMVGPCGIGNEEKFSGWEYKAAGAVATIANPFDSSRVDAVYYYAEDAAGRNMVEIPVSPDGTYGYKPTPTASHPLAITLGSSGIVFLNGAWKTAGYVGAMIRTLDKVVA